MAATRSNTNLLNGVTTTTTSSNIDVSTDYGREVYVKIVVVGSPSSAASFFFSYSVDGTNYTYQSPTYNAGTSATTYYFVVTLPLCFKKFNMTFTAQTGGTSSTCTADLAEVTGV